ncbi:MAG: hypothetical protein JWP30_1086, partial [Homoserinimonas sp.]|nr:hypothetical protein [Homoserinimonas sp.]
LPVGVTFGVGLGLMLVFVIAGRVLMRPWGIWFGWALQALLVATGIILTPMYIVGAGFAGIWVYCFITGRRIDSQKAAVRRAS